MKLTFSKLAMALLALCEGYSFARADDLTLKQATLSHRSAHYLRIEGLSFKDLNNNGRLDPYEDWRRSPERRARDLVKRMSLEELAGLLFHSNIPSTEPISLSASGLYDFDKTGQLIALKHINSFVCRSNEEPGSLAASNNRLQAMAEATTLGIPLTINSNPRSQIDFSPLTNLKAATFSKWPDPAGLAAIADPKLVREFADIVRQEYLAVGIRKASSPQADLATEPRWTRVNGTFGEDAQVAKEMVKAYVEGMQNGDTGLHVGSVATIVKHWVGYGAQRHGFDSHNSYGRDAVFPGNNFTYHIIPFTGAFEANTADVMPAYSILRGVSINGRAVEPVGAGFNRQVITELLRNTYHFKGVVVTDWSVTLDCGQNCEYGAAAGQTPTFDAIGMPWGVEDLNREQRIAKAINAGVDQIGGTDESGLIIAAVKDGLLSRARIEESAYRVLLQKFQLGLFEDPYVDEKEASRIVGNAEFVRLGEEAQSRSLVLLENKQHLLPYEPQARKVYIYGIDSKIAESFGFIVTDSPSSADLAIIRASVPFETLHPNYPLGRMQHEGRLDFQSGDKGYDAFEEASARVPTILVVDLNRPAILTNVRQQASALVASFGVNDRALLNVLTGKISPHAHLPFELPSSMAEVQNQREDVPHDTAHPLYAYGYGLSY
jgi:beta-glucosidase